MRSDGSRWSTEWSVGVAAADIFPLVDLGNLPLRGAARQRGRCRCAAALPDFLGAAGCTWVCPSSPFGDSEAIRTRRGLPLGLSLHARRRHHPRSQWVAPQAAVVPDRNAGVLNALAVLNGVALRRNGGPTRPERAGTQEDASVQVFEFLRNYRLSLDEPIRAIKDHQWHRFTAEFLHDEWISTPKLDGEDSDDVVVVFRPPQAAPPVPDEDLKRWLPAFGDPFAATIAPLLERNFVGPDGEPVRERFDEQTKRVAMFEEWLGRWIVWAEAERPKKPAKEAFEEFHALLGRLSRDGGTTEIVLGLGLLTWRHPAGSIHHPILVTPLELRAELESPSPCFRLVQTSSRFELVTDTFRHIDTVDRQQLALCRHEVATRAEDPEGLDVGAFLRRFSMALSARATVGAEEVNPEGTEPRGFSTSQCWSCGHGTLGSRWRWRGLPNNSKHRAPTYRCLSIESWVPTEPRYGRVRMRQRPPRKTITPPPERRSMSFSPNPPTKSRFKLRRGSEIPDVFWSKGHRARERRTP